MTKSLLPRAALLALLAALAAGCGHRTSTTAAADAGPPATVTVLRAAAGRATRWCCPRA